KSQDFVNQGIPLGRAEVLPRRHCRTRHSPDEDCVQILTRRNVVRRADQAKAAGGDIAWLWEQKRRRHAARIACVSVTGGAVARVEFFSISRFCCLRDDWNRTGWL